MDRLKAQPKSTWGFGAFELWLLLEEGFKYGSQMGGATRIMEAGKQDLENDNYL